MLNWVLGKKYSRMRRHLHWMPICTRVAQKNNTSDFWMPIDFSFLLSKRDCTLKISRMSKLLSSYGRASDVYIQMYRLNFNHRFQLNHTSSLTFPLEATELKKTLFFGIFLYGDLLMSRCHTFGCDPMTQEVRKCIFGFKKLLLNSILNGYRKWIISIFLIFSKYIFLWPQKAKIDRHSKIQGMHFLGYSNVYIVQHSNWYIDADGICIISYILGVLIQSWYDIAYHHTYTYAQTRSR